MNPIVQRVLASIVLATTGFVALAASSPSPATASVSTEVEAFVFEVFPHESTAVNFWDSWGARRSGGRRHQGTDIMSPKGTPVLAVADGIVHEMGTHRLSGYFVRLDHGNGYLTTYMHLNNDTLGTDDGDGGPWTAYHATLYEGKEVRAGEVIGYVGDSGNAEGTRPHTHFEVNLDGRKMNPYPWLADAWIKTHSDPKLPITIAR